MQTIGAIRLPLTLAVLATGILTSTAQAYLDPGTGSIILQVLLGGAAGLALAGKLYWNKFLSLIGMRKKSDDRQMSSEGMDGRS